MKKKIIIVSTILLISLAIGGSTFAWFSAEDSSIGSQKLSTIQLETVGANENAIVKNIGTGNVYVRVRLIPQWSDPSLSVSNMTLNLNIDSDWTGEKSDGYHYFKRSLEKGGTTSNILDSITPGTLGPEYSEASFRVQIVAEGVQTNNEALDAVWGISSLPID